jgi:hypothetical protein
MKKDEPKRLIMLFPSSSTVIIGGLFLAAMMVALVVVAVPMSGSGPGGILMMALCALVFGVPAGFLLWKLLLGPLQWKRSPLKHPLLRGLARYGNLEVLLPRLNELIRMGDLVSNIEINSGSVRKQDAYWMIVDRYVLYFSQFHRCRVLELSECNGIGVRDLPLKKVPHLGRQVFMMYLDLYLGTSLLALPLGGKRGGCPDSLPVVELQVPDLHRMRFGCASLGGPGVGGDWLRAVMWLQTCRPPTPRLPDFRSPVAGNRAGSALPR